MYRSSAKRLSALIVTIVAGLFLVSTPAVFGAKVEPKAGAKVVKPTTIHAVASGVSRPLRLAPPPSHGRTLREIPNKPPQLHPRPNLPKFHDPLIQRRPGAGLIPDPIVSYDGIPDVDGVQPADTTLDVSPSQVLQWVNLSYFVTDKSGTTLGGPFEGNSFWSGLPPENPCNNFNGGDVLVRWDQFASQWWVSQLAYPGGPDGFHQCVAVSTTSDALGTYFQYDFLYSLTDLNDYPKVGLWPIPGSGAGGAVINNGYYITVRNFANFADFTGMKIIALDRAAMLGGSPGTAQVFDVGELAPSLDGLLPADLRGTNVPADGSLETYIGYGHPATDGSSSPVIHLFQTFTDFSNPLNSFLTQLPDIDIADFDPNLFNGAPQQGGGNLETLPFAMYRSDYRVFTDHDSLLLLHDVNVSESGEQGGARWHEVRGINPLAAVPNGGGPTLYQEGTYGPDDGIYRWMGSIGQDASGNIALGFSASSDGSAAIVDPSVHYTGRLSTDPLGEMAQGEGTFFDSTQPFGGFRWGDYSTIVTDPVDQCTFWYTTMYGAGDWNTRIGSFKFPSCTTGPSGTLEGTVSDGTNPIPGATVTAGLSSTTTDASGHYLFVLPVGTYDVTASKYGFLPETVNDVEVTDGGDTVQDFVLSPAPTVFVNGTVKDGSGGGWPLYAKLVITGPGAPTFTLYTDPVTGYYSLTLVTGLSYNFAVTAVSSGYLPGGGPVPLTVFVPAVVKNFTLTVNPETCNAPGYNFGSSALAENFDAGVVPPGWSLVTNSGNPWSVVSADPCGFFFNLTGGTGPFAVANSNCDGFVLDDSELHSPSIDLTGQPNAVVAFNSDFFCCFAGSNGIADVDISTNGGTSWTNVFQRNGVDERGPIRHTIDITGLAAGQPDVRARFHYYNNFFTWWWQVDNFLFGNAACQPGPGGLVVGNVRDANTGFGLSGATVENLAKGTSTTTFATPEDPNQDDGLYILYADDGPHSFEASLPPYTPQTKNTTVIPGGTIRLDFSLGAGRLDASPRPLTSIVDPGDTDEQTLNITNTGAATASFTIHELNAPPPGGLARPQGFFVDPDVKARALARIPKGQAFAKDANHLPAFAARPVQPLAAGEVSASYPTNITYGWGIAYNTDVPDFWVSNLAIVGGDDKDYRYLVDGTLTGDTIDDTTWVGVFAADGAYNPRTGKLWRVNVGGDNCIYELDPILKVATGNKICPNFGTSERGLAYDAVTDTYYSGSWNDGVINHFDGKGTILESAYVGLAISGLGYNTSTGHLFVQTNHGPVGGYDIYVLDAQNNFTLIGGYFITENGNPAGSFNFFGGAGLEIDCDGNLILVDQGTQTIFVADSGETGFCAINDIPWLSEIPTSGTVNGTGSGGSNPFPVTVTFDSTGLTPGLYRAQLTFLTDTPYSVAPDPVCFTVRFLDVPDDNQFAAYIYGAAGAGIMPGSPYPGCAGTNNFCPNGVVTRADMAGYIERAVHGADFVPPTYAGGFDDVASGDYNADYIQGLVDDGITAGCSADPPLYCPNNPNTRAQMSVFILKAEHGSSYVPPACTGIFADVPCPSLFADWIEALFNEGVTAGCGGGNFCPNDSISNGQMSVFLDKAFHVGISCQ
ncbi:MAG TPA: carboxypeptidase regulatory-like domain-containing protein [Thermoanaerobaculia bacterium]|jgi:hypothetical protein